MTVWIDPPVWPAHGTVFSHLVSDTTYVELHAVAARAGLSRRAFDGDHYDVPADRHDDLLRAGACATSGADLVRRLNASGLRLRKRKGDKGLARLLAHPTPLGPADLDVVASRRPVVGATHHAVLVPDPGPWGVPFAPAEALPASAPPVGWVRISSASGILLVQVFGRPSAALPVPWRLFDTA